jgi:predicted enzyme related to lactoylglutathione lyase
MARALGIGGVFFKCDDGPSLGEWYRKWLGVPYGPYGASFKTADVPSGTWQAWSPFKRDTTYFDPSDSAFMINLIVDDLDEALAQVREGGAQVMEEIEESEYGRFGWFIDPAGMKVELWVPPLTRPGDVDGDG